MEEACKVNKENINKHEEEPRTNEKIFQKFNKLIKNKYLIEQDKIDIILDFENLSVNILIENQSLNSFKTDKNSNKVKLKSIKKKMDLVLSKAEITMKKEMKMKNKIIESTILLFKSQIMNQIMNYYSIGDIFEKNHFKGIFFSKKRIKLKESFVFILEIPETHFGWDSIKTFLEKTNKENTIKHYNKILKYLNSSTTNYDTNEQSEINNHNKSLLYNSNNANNNNLELNYDKKDDNDENINLLHLKSNYHEQEKHSSQIPLEKVLDKDNEETEENNLKALNLISYYTVINAMSVASMFDLNPVHEENYIYLEDQLLEEECKPYFFVNLLLSMFEDLKEGNGNLYMIINLFLTTQKKNDKEKYEEIKKIKDLRERIKQLKDFVLNSYKKFFLMYGIILCFTFEINTEYNIIYNQVHIEMSCDYDSYIRLAISKTVSLELEMSEKGKNTIKNYTEYKLLKKHLISKSSAPIAEVLEVANIENEKKVFSKELIQHIHIKFFPAAEELYKFYDEEDQEIELNEEICQVLTIEDKNHVKELNNQETNQEEGILKTKTSITNYMADFVREETNNFSQVKKGAIENSTNLTVLRSVDRMRMLSLALDDLINFGELTSSEIYKETRIKRYQHKFNKYNFYSYDLNIFNNDKTQSKITNFRNSFGESAAFYIAWTNHFIKWIMMLLVMMTIYKVSEFFISEGSHIIFNINLRLWLQIVFILFFILIWLTFYMFSWKTREKVLLTSWGKQTNAKERNREEYEPYLQFKLLTTKVFINNKAEELQSYLLSILVTALMIGFTIYSLTYIQLMYEPIEDKNKLKGNLLNKTLIEVSKLNNFTNTNMDSSSPNNTVNLVFVPLPFYVPILTGVYCLILYKIYSWLCKILTDNENHRLLREYNKSYIIKITCFNLICYYYTIYYIIFVKSFNGTCLDNDCTSDLISYLRSIFFTNYINTFIEIGIPFISFYFFNLRASKSLKKMLSLESTKITSNSDTDLNNSNIQTLKYKIEFSSKGPKKLKEDHLIIISNMISKEYSYLYKPTYDNIMGEYDQIIFLFGFVAQFIIIDYLLIIFFIIYLFIQRIVDSKKIVDFYNACLFEYSDGIGIYKYILKLICLLSVCTNLYVLFFIKSNQFSNNSNRSIVTTNEVESEIFTFRNFILIQNVFVLIVFFVKLDFVPRWVYYNQALTHDFNKKTEHYAYKK
jgi:hypothetical protein